MRQSRRLALILAMLAGALPLTASAQNAAGNRAPANNRNAAASDEEEEEEEEEAAPARPAASAPAASNSAAARPATPETPETDEERRTRILPRFSTLGGAVGLLHTASAQTGGAGSFRFGLLGEYFSGGGFLRPDGLAGTMLTGQDSASHVGGTVTLSYSPLDFLEVFGSVRAYATSNSSPMLTTRPGLIQALGDATLGVKAGARVVRGLYLGGDAAVYLLNRAGDIGVLGDATSFHLRLNSTFDLREHIRNAPVRFHFNVRYYFDNSSAVVAPTEDARRRAQPGYDAARCATTNDASCYLEVSRAERYALGVNRVDRLSINLGAEASLPYVHPFVEWNVGVPVNRQSYQCFEPGATGTRPGGGTDDDLCFANTGFASMPSTFTIGARVLPPIRGLSALLAVDIATSGTSSFVRELSPNTPWQFYFGAAFAYDSHPVERRIEVPGPERRVEVPVDRTPPGGHVTGMVRDAEGHTGVANAVVTFAGRNDLHLLATDGQGRFLSGRLPPGDYQLRVTAPDYNPGECRFTIAAPAAPAAPAGGSSTAAAPAAEANLDTTVQCEVRAMPRRGSLQGRVVNGRTNQPVAGVQVTINPGPGFLVPQGQSAPTAQTVTSDAGGGFTLNDVLAGSYVLAAGQSANTMAAAGVNATVSPRETASVDVRVNPVPPPAQRQVTLVGNNFNLRQQVHFQTNSADILPDSNSLLEQLADAINRHPEVTAIEIQGHTDNQGQAAANQTLSEARAASVRDALVRLGVNADRLSSRGYGQTRPIRPNLTAAGRAANRRVQIVVTARTGAAARPAAARPVTP
jgi:outer membrane protein OmpA-like peptidoglycan-associated protein